MTESAIVEGEFVTYSHVKTRKVFTITIEFPEESALHVLNTLGAPVGGDSKPVAVALLDKSIVDLRPFSERVLDMTPTVYSKTELTEGEKLRTRAIMICKDEQFQRFVADVLSDIGYAISVNDARDAVCDYCSIKSRAELATNKDAQDAFNVMLRQFDEWKVSNRYAENLSR